VKEGSYHVTTQPLNMYKPIRLSDLIYYLYQWGSDLTDIAIIRITD